MSTDLLEPSAPVTTVHTHLRPIDRDGLTRLRHRERCRALAGRRGVGEGGVVALRAGQLLLFHLLGVLAVGSLLAVGQVLAVLALPALRAAGTGDVAVVR